VEAVAAPNLTVQAQRAPAAARSGSLRRRPSREALIGAMKGLTDFDAGGFLGKRSFANGKITPCFMVVQFKGGKWIRQYPTKKGTFDCKSSNAIAIKANLIQQ